MASTMQLEFAQAMSDFKTMFPEMDKDVIEAVLRANQGAVDATIDQLLAMSTDNQNEQLRNEMDMPDAIVSATKSTMVNASTVLTPSNRQIDLLLNTTNIATTASAGTAAAAAATNTGASPKIKKTTPNSPTTNFSSIPLNPVAATSFGGHHSKKWDPPMIGPLPATFLRITADPSTRTECDIPDEQFALMLQNEEFMNELRWNQDFMLALEKEQHDRDGRGDGDDAQFKERLKYMGKKSRKKFMQLAKVFTRQRTKKPGAVRHPDSLLLQEDHSEDDEPKRLNKK